ncbi:glycosyl transferase family 2 [Thermoanaerobacterium thermosaccharolyticum]|uniref:Glycosyl transferase family 2 n=3 Tax=Thermoanaerobacterium thermosaccharolyticum TaxID=1517 RepID=D9TLT0_THETC|nr:glycosyltransferase family 2 protein [Thermoanaerobacterium thermosaccharolyticum]ADL70013.1 glycosyl transferase family 2 [Thermoanaerobacterium thermosaccharolyticum DSM 571]AGB20178.1 putative glycosyltransferase [Thermoanaerobacterium thermosaccharolyticum M0795]AST57246.1 glycosyl transferase family 2 [Thermoanaerobacterium thermosaccharolyticum]PHO07536.1 glycosyl transferase family 2 [Thermoanaerobacterium thermosaccharolyticum]
MPKIIVIVPAYNEEKTIDSVIYNIKKNKDVDILVVNDGSSDKTSLIAKNNGVIVIDLPFNLGIGGCMQTGYKYAYKNGYDIAIQIDADGQHDARFIDELIKPILNDEADLVIGSRYVAKTNYRGSYLRRTGSRFFTFLLKILTGYAIYDSTSGFRAANRKVIKYFSESYPQDYPEVEVIAKLSKMGFRMREIPVEMHERLGGQSSINFKRSIYYMVKVTLAILVNCMSRKEHQKA